MRAPFSRLRLIPGRPASSEPGSREGPARRTRRALLDGQRTVFLGAGRPEASRSRRDAQISAGAHPLRLPGERRRGNAGRNSSQRSDAGTWWPLRGRSEVDTKTLFSSSSLMMTMPWPMAHGGDCAAPRHRAGRSRAESLSQLGGSTPCVSCTHRGARARRGVAHRAAPRGDGERAGTGPGAGGRKVPFPRLVRADRSPCRAPAKRRLGRYRCIAAAPGPERREACVRCAPFNADTVCSRRRAARLQGPFSLRLPHREMPGRGSSSASRSLDPGRDSWAP